ncbi:MAG: hypothetical protein JJ863_03810 [Deltaproteobacteria bacterium]|nr:hypothetical protein [Deltaproteobacteria bacterium]
MDLVDKIERSRFLGRELLVWLWFESERREGLLSLPGGDGCELWLEEQLTLVAEKAETKLKAGAPSTTPEAKEALRQGKLPTKAKMRITRGPQSWSFVFDADSLSVSGVKVPAQITEDTDEKFYERMQLVEELEAMLGGLYERFVELRTSQGWESEAAAIREWVEA